MFVSSMSTMSMGLASELFASTIDSLFSTGKLPNGNTFKGGVFISVMKLPQEGVGPYGGFTPRVIDFFDGPAEAHDMAASRVSRQAYLSFEEGTKGYVINQTQAPSVHAMSDDCVAELSQREYTIGYDNLGLRYCSHQSQPEGRIYDELSTLIPVRLEVANADRVVPVSIGLGESGAHGYIDPTPHMATFELSLTPPVTNALATVHPVYRGAPSSDNRRNKIPQSSVTQVHHSGCTLSLIHI